MKFVTFKSGAEERLGIVDDKKGILDIVKAGRAVLGQDMPADMLFDCAQIVASLSTGLTLEPGDTITTGTPSGVALGMDPPLWLKDGDTVELMITGIGTLTNRVRQIG